MIKGAAKVVVITLLICKKKECYLTRLITLKEQMS